VAAGRSKVVCTIGPACWELSQLEALIDAGMNVARFNFSHGDHATHAATLERVREAAKNRQRNVGAYESAL
jgi:pyruvate kinase